KQRLIVPAYDLRANDLVFAFDDVLIPLLRRPDLSLIIFPDRRAFGPGRSPNAGSGAGRVGSLRSDQPPHYALKALTAGVAPASRDAKGPIRRVQEQGEVVRD